MKCLKQLKAIPNKFKYTIFGYIRKMEQQLEVSNIVAMIIIYVWDIIILMVKILKKQVMIEKSQMMEWAQQESLSQFWEWALKIQHIASNGLD